MTGTMRLRVRYPDGYIQLKDRSKDIIISGGENISSIEVEEALYQVKNQSGQDPLNFPIKLNNRLASLRRSVESGEAKPTNGAYKVYEELSAELTIELNKLNGIFDKYKSKINPILIKSGGTAID